MWPEPSRNKQVLRTAEPHSVDGTSSTFLLHQDRQPSIHLRPVHLQTIFGAAKPFTLCQDLLQLLLSALVELGHRRAVLFLKVEIAGQAVPLLLITFFFLFQVVHHPLAGPKVDKRIWAFLLVTDFFVHRLMILQSAAKTSRRL